MSFGYWILVDSLKTQFNPVNCFFLQQSWNNNNNNSKQTIIIITTTANNRIKMSFEELLCISSRWLEEFRLGCHSDGYLYLIVWRSLSPNSELVKIVNIFRRMMMTIWEREKNERRIEKSRRRQSYISLKFFDSALLQFRLNYTIVMI